MMKPDPSRRSKPSEEGYVLLAVMFLLVLLTISLAIALPKMSKEIQRDRELETMQRGKQYIRAIRLYYKKFGAYPPNVDALVKPTNNIRFLRKKYVDPTTGKEDWKPIRYGQNKCPTAMGFFGQPLAGSTIAGTGSSSSSGLSSDTSTTDSSATQSQTASSATSSAASTSSTATGSTTGLTGKSFGGGGIIGFSPNSPKQSILVYKKKNHYNEWEFVYDPIMEQLYTTSNTANNAGLASSSTSTSSTSSSTSSSSSSSSSTTTTTTQ
jgi:type II secretory pathway pseudopilin PulG